uniref:Uncharacterized protein n=1 Tax=Candidatus Kentrum sp. TC TaxID=2126339 RepID=A0A450YBH5_9GAMM|nr:MAG: hypothetical protein BECKTC1821E_GA0114239_100315 [Candidatus Kentron sp. TC]VFK54436.1 MAG: hypothetical protein BECKTC1821F_GA0114240_100514 [Candidatus Kentron sp. TC]
MPRHRSSGHAVIPEEKERRCAPRPRITPTLRRSLIVVAYPDIQRERRGISSVNFPHHFLQAKPPNTPTRLPGSNRLSSRWRLSMPQCLLRWNTALGTAMRPKRDSSRSDIAWPICHVPLPVEQCFLYRDEPAQVRFGFLGASRFRSRRGKPASHTCSSIRTSFKELNSMGSPKGVPVPWASI